MTNAAAGLPLREALAAFDFGGEVAGALRYGNGHINDTYAVYTQQPDGRCRRYILQRINTHVFKDPDGLMENILGVTGHLRRAIAAAGGDSDRETLTVLRPKNGAAYHAAPGGGCWRCYYFIEDAVCYETVGSPEIFRAAARAFGRFMQGLADYPTHTLHETIPGFHNTPQRLQALKNAVAADTHGRAAGCMEEIHFALEREAECGTLVDKQDTGELPLRVTHNDTKLNNIMMHRDRPLGLCVIDLDTVMPGLALHDYGDAIRFGANTAQEDARDISSVSFSLPLFQTYTEGYLETAGPALTPLEKQLLPWGAKLMTLECGIRFLTDHLEGDHYFRKNRGGQNLDRSRTQFKLVRDMEAAWQQMNEITTYYSELLLR